MLAPTADVVPDPVRTLITGVNGFVGQWLAHHLSSERGPEHATSTRLWGMAWGRAGRAALADMACSLEVLDGDLGDSASLRAAAEISRPELVYHLAGASSVAASWSEPSRALEINALGQLRLLEALSAAGLQTLTVLASSAEVYGRSAGDRPITEQAEVAPVSPYGVSKAAQELVARMYSASRGLPSIVLRLFNLVGPGQSPAFAASSFARQVAEIEHGLRRPVLAVGDLRAVRDFTDVRDAARAFRLVSLHGAPGAVYNLCSGTAVPVQDLLDILLALATRPIQVEIDEARLRTADIAVLCGDPARLHDACGWRPEIGLEQTMADLLGWWRRRIGDETTSDSDPVE